MTEPPSPQMKISVGAQLGAILGLVLSSVPLIRHKKMRQKKPGIIISIDLGIRGLVLVVNAPLLLLSIHIYSRL
jgi:hypothetical protein